MARIADLRIDLSASGRKLRRDLRNARAEWRRYSRAVRADMQKLATGVKIAATAGIGALTLMSRAALRNADEIAKAARNAGLAATEYQALSHVWRLAGSDAGSLVKASQALSRNVLNLERGLSTSVDVFEKLGLAWRDLAGLSPGEQLRLVLHRLRGVTDESIRAGIAQQLLGRAGRSTGSGGWGASSAATRSGTWKRSTMRSRC